MKSKYTTTYDGQTAISIEVYQGEQGWVKDNYKLGEFLLEGIPDNVAGEENIEVKFRYNLNGILEVSAKCISTESEISVTMHDALERESQQSFEDSIAKIESLYNSTKEDIDWDEMFDLENDEINEEQTLEELEEELKNLINKLNNIQESLDKSGRKRIQKLIQKAEKAIENHDVEAMESGAKDILDFMIDFEL